MQGNMGSSGHFALRVLVQLHRCTPANMLAPGCSPLPSGGCINVTELAQTVCATLDNAAGTIYLSNLKKDRQERLCDAICKHGESSCRCRWAVGRYGAASA